MPIGSAMIGAGIGAADSHGYSASLGGARGGSGAAPYQAASGVTQEMAAYWPSNSSGDSATLHHRRVALDRARDIARNDPHAAAGVMRLVDMIVGHGWQCVPTPDARALGVDPKVARELGRDIRSEWKLFSRDPRYFADARRRITVNGMFRLAARTFASANEATAVIRYDRRRVERRGARYATCLAQIDPDRLSNPNGAGDSRYLRGGVEFDSDDVPIAYHFRNAHVADRWAALQQQTWTRVPRETPHGRPIVIHAFEPEREDQTRAITPFAALISRLRMIGKFSDTELASATANALFAAFVKTDLPPEEVAQRLAAGDAGAAVRASYIDKVVDHYTRHPVSLGGVRIPVMLPNSEVVMNNAPRQTTAFPAFQAAFLQSIASALGISYEQLSMDWSRTNYSSARAAMNEVWRAIKRMQAVFAEQYVQPFYFAWIEEAFDKGYLRAPAGAPDFWDMPEAYIVARWIGPGRGYIDPTKEAEAAALRMGSLTSSLEIENAEQGLDWEENLEQIAFEHEVMAEMGVERQPVGAAQAKSAKPDNEDHARDAKEAA